MIWGTGVVCMNTGVSVYKAMASMYHCFIQQKYVKIWRAQHGKPRFSIGCFCFQIEAPPLKYCTTNSDPWPSPAKWISPLGINASVYFYYVVSPLVASLWGLFCLFTQSHSNKGINEEKLNFNAVQRDLSWETLTSQTQMHGSLQMLRLWIVSWWLIRMSSWRGGEISFIGWTLSQCKIQLIIPITHAVQILVQPIHFINNCDHTR